MTISSGHVKVDKGKAVLSAAVLEKRQPELSTLLSVASQFSEGPLEINLTVWVP